MSVVRLTCAVYWLLLTVLLLVPDPLALVGIHGPIGPPGGRMIHFLFFTVLALLICVSRWPIRRGLLAGLAVAFALATEMLQGFVPQRKVELLDLTENLLGLATGTAIWCLIRNKLVGPTSPRE